MRTQKCVRWLGQSRLRYGGIALLMLLSMATAQAQVGPPANKIATKEVAVQQHPAVAEINAITCRNFETLEQLWREFFRQTRRPERLRVFVNESLDLFEKARQIRDFVEKPAATEARLNQLFRNRVLNDEAVCKAMEVSMANYLKALDEQDQNLLIRLKIDREVGRTELSKEVIDPAAFRKPIVAVAAAATKAARDDIQRTVGTVVASEVISAGVKGIAQETGLITKEANTLEGFIGGLLIELAVVIAVDAATDPSQKMVNDLHNRLQEAERTILDSQDATPGFLTVLKRHTQERMLARQRLAAEHSK